MEKIINSTIIANYKIKGILDLSKLSLDKLPRDIVNYRQAKIIDLSDNLLTDIELLSDFSDLEVLLIKNNLIKNLKSISKLVNLKIIDLDNNKIEDITGFESLKYLERLYLRNNEITYLPEAVINSSLKLNWETRETYYSGIYLSGNPLEFPPIEIVMQGKIAIDAYFASIKKASQALNEVKLILIGDGAAGKTSLLKRLLSLEFNSRELQTHGIRIERDEVNVNDESIKINFWDFGGQEIMHSTHQFFLSRRCIYLLVLDSRKDESAEYWLKHISSFGGDAPVFVVLNKIDENPSFEIDQSFLSEKYPNILSYNRISCATGEGIEDLKLFLNQSIYNSEMRKTPFSKDWFAVKEIMGNLKIDYIGYDKFINICTRNNVTQKSQQSTLLGFLHDLGILLHFDSLRYYDTQVMNPSWLTNGVYRIINSPIIVKNGGVFTTSQIEEIVNDNDRYGTNIFHYPANKCLFLIKIMQKFEICYALNDDSYILPELLPIRRFERTFKQQEEILIFNVYYENFLPNAIFPKLMVQLHHLIRGEAKWRTGMIIEERYVYKSTAYLFIDKEALRIIIEVSGENKREFLLYIRKTIQDISQSYTKVEYRELIILSDLHGKKIPIDFNELLGYEVGNQKVFYSGLLRKEFVVKDLIDKYEPLTFRQNPDLNPTTVFISYSHIDDKYREELRKALSPLWRLNKIKLWDDRAINLGSLWEEEIGDNLKKADIVVLLISPDFINSEFCYTKELDLAYKDYIKGKKVLLPIRLRSVNYHELPIGKIQGIPLGWLVTDYESDKRDKVWTEIAEKIGQLSLEISEKKYSFKLI